MFKKYCLLLLVALAAFSAYSQAPQDLSSVSYSTPKKYTIGGIQVTGVKYLNKSTLMRLSGLKIGDEVLVPGDKITKGVKKLWEQGMFSDIQIYASKIVDDKIYLELSLKERPRLSDFKFEGVKKTHLSDLKEKIELTKGKQVTDDLLNRATRIIKNYYTEKGFHNTHVRITQKNDTNYLNTVILTFYVDKKEKVRINDIVIEGNTVFPDEKVRRFLKETKKRRWYGMFKPSKYIETQYADDKEKLLAKYKEKGYRDVEIVSDSIVVLSDNRINIYLKLNEGNKYYFRNISWVGNTKYTSDQLIQSLKIKKGDVYDQDLLQNRLTVDMDAVGNLYLDDGYLFFNATPVEGNMENDSIDVEIRLTEGPQARINNVIISGNSKTNDHVIRREIKTLPGELFSKSDIVRTVRELAQMGHFDPEQIVPNPVPNMADGTVDIEYSLVEKPNDQIEVSGGWGAGMLIGTVGLKFNNFSARNILNGKEWRPIPSGDGQSLGLSARSNGRYYQSYSISFTEPWLGGKKPNSLSVSYFHNRYHYSGKMITNGVTIGLGRRLKFPDDYFTLYNSLGIQKYDISNYGNLPDGPSKIISLTNVISRNSSGPSPLYPMGGSEFSLSLQLTPPYSMLRPTNFWEATDAEKEADPKIEDKRKIEWVEYHKWKFKAAWYTNIVDKFVLFTRAEYGFLGSYSPNLQSPYEGFAMGGDGMVGYQGIYGRDMVSHRGYSNQLLTNHFNNGLSSGVANIYNKYTFELRYPVSMEQSATIYLLGFVEAGNAWSKFQKYNPYDLKRSAGVGVRIFLPMLGLLGVDWGYGFDNIYDESGNVTGGKKGEFHLVLGQQF